MNINRIMNPSGLPREFCRSDKCHQEWVRQSSFRPTWKAPITRLSVCICSYAKKARDTVSVPALLKSKEWAGSSVEPCTHKGRAANKLTHPSGAVAYIYA